MEKKRNKIVEFFTTDIKAINSYMIIAIIAITIIAIGSSSYALFSYENTSTNTIALSVGQIGTISVAIFGQNSGSEVGTLNKSENKLYFDVETGYVMEGFSCTTGTPTYDSYNNILTVTNATANGICEVTFKAGLDTSGANRPELAEGMIPVYYDSISNVWRKADSGNGNVSYKWYNYDEHMWANAVTVTEVNSSRTDLTGADLGTEIPMSRINTMLVWIPRFNAVVPGSKGVINVTFVDKNTEALDAFTFGTQNLSGYWVGKFEITGTLASACTTETCNISNVTIKPNTKALTYQTVSSFFYAMRSMEQSGNVYGFNTTIDTTLDTHMMKNNEWGAVAYLTQSNYGRCISGVCSEVWINPVNTLNGAASQYGPTITGCSGSSVSAGMQNSMSACTSGYEYNGTNNNGKSSTTGNVYGIYDMSGGTWDYVMGNLNNTISYSNFSSIPESKYINIYTETTYTGHALTETAGWYSDRSYFVNASSPWFVRGGVYTNGAYAGVFNFYYSNGRGADGVGSRVSVTK